MLVSDLVNRLLDYMEECDDGEVLVIDGKVARSIEYLGTATWSSQGIDDCFFITSDDPPVFMSEHQQNEEFLQGFRAPKKPHLYLVKS